MPRTPHIKVYLSDEGYGHIVRQRAIIEALRKQRPDLRFTLQTRDHLKAVQRIIPEVDTVERFNNISWSKHSRSGSPDVHRIRADFQNYLSDTARWIAQELEDFEFDLVISDFVYEAFEVAHRKNIPCVGVAHFTWDWFFSKLYPPPLESEVIEQFFDYASKATQLFFPPFTPVEILNHYTSAQEVPLILHSDISHKEVAGTKEFKVMIIDSGSQLLASSIKKALTTIGQLEGFRFYVNEVYSNGCDNVASIPQHHLLADYFNSMDLVIGRAGFNTISECIGLRTPMVLLGEAANPEMLENIVNLKNSNLGTFISIETFENELDTFLIQFVKNEYSAIQKKMNTHSLQTNGAQVIASAILEYIK